MMDSRRRAAHDDDVDDIGDGDDEGDPKALHLGGEEEAGNRKLL
jgi:hypothetical protein